MTKFWRFWQRILSDFTAWLWKTVAPKHRGSHFSQYRRLAAVQPLRTGR